MGDGWFKLHRKILDSRVFSDDKALKVWIWCLCRASHKDRFWNGQDIPAGSFATGRNTAASETGMSASSFYRSLRKLEEWGMVTLKANSKWTTVSVCNWTTYQQSDIAERTASGQQVDSKWTASGQQVDTVEECKKDKKVDVRARFVKPTVAEVADYCRGRGNEVDASRFVDHYESNGWKVGRNTMKDWKAAVRTWEKNWVDGGVSGKKPTAQESFEEYRNRTQTYAY